MNFAEWPLPMSMALFAAAAVAVWIAGTRLARLADTIAEKTGVGREMLGMLLLGGVTSSPELAVAVTATLSGAPLLSVNDVLGSAAINLVILAAAVAAVGRDSLTSKLPSSGVMLQGVVCIIVLALAAAPAIAGDRLLFGIGMWSWAMLLTYVGCLRMLAHSQTAASWMPANKPSAPTDETAAVSDDRTLRRIILATVATGAVILVAGFLLARTGEAIAENTGLGTSFFGAIVLGFSTSLPEVSTVLAAVKLRRYTMAISDVFGTNLFNVTILVLVDALHPGGPVLVAAGPFAGFAALVAVALTAIFLVGMLERRDRTLLRMGVDSIAVVLVYAVGVVVLYGLR